MKRIYYILIIVVVVIISVYAITRLTGNNEVLTFETSTVEKGDVSSIITATGSLEAITTVDVGTQVSGIIQDIYVDFNSTVKKGEVIAKLDTTALYSSLQNVEADLEQKEANLEYYKKNFERVKLLYESNTVAESDYDQAKWNYQTAKANYLSSKSNLEKAQINLSYAIIISPINGVVISRSVDKGQTVAASFSTPTLFSIAQDLTKMQVVASIDEADIGQVKNGNRVTFTVDAFPDDEFEGKVIQVRLEPTVTSNVVTYDVLIDAPNPDLKLMPGMTANLNVIVDEEKDVLKIKSKALRYSPSQETLMKMMKKRMAETKGERPNMPPPGNNSQQSGSDVGRPNMFSNDLADGEAIVWVKSDDFIMPKKIKTGLSDGTNTVILDGLQKGDQVVSGENITTKKEQKEETQNSPFMPGPPR